MRDTTLLFASPRPTAQAYTASDALDEAFAIVILVTLFFDLVRVFIPTLIHMCAMFTCVQPAERTDATTWSRSEIPMKLYIHTYK